ncbi:FecR family protein [Chitinophaga barathri]|nr:FecR domain-containing protein [Chitinophaga barathri]
MTNIPEEGYISQLMSEKLAGIISPEDDAHLCNLIETDPQTRAAWEEYRSRFPQEHLDNQFAAADQINWKPLPPRRKIFRWQYAAAAAAIAIGIFVLLPGKEPAPATSAHTEGIRLTLADGRQLSPGQPAASPQKGFSLQKDSLLVDAGTPAPGGYNELEVPTGMDYRVVLPDGSIVWLNAASKLTFPFAFTGPERKVTVSGEAFFEVTPDHTHPFIVETPNGRVEVLGTSFNVNSYDSSQVKISLLSGAVQVHQGEQAMLLKPGRQAVVTNTAAIRETAFAEEQTLSWRKGWFWFEDTHLTEIAGVITRWYGVTVKMDDENVTRQVFTGRLDKTTALDVFLKQLKSTKVIDYYFDNAGSLHFK